MTDEKAKQDIFKGEQPQETPAPEQPQEAIPEQEPQKPDVFDALYTKQVAEEENKKAAQTEQPTKEQKNKTEEFYQTRYQQQTEKLKRFHPEIYKQLHAEKGENKQETPKKNDADYSDDVTLTPDLLAKMVREAVREEAGGLLQKQRQEDFFALEQQVADETIRGFREAGASDEDLAAAYTTVVNKFGFSKDSPGGPSSIATAMADELELRELRRRSGQRATTASEEAKAKIESAMKVAQPSPTSPPAPKEKSFDETVVEMMKNVGNPEAKRQIFKGAEA